MRTLIIAGAALSLLAVAGPADAQRIRSGTTVNAPGRVPIRTAQIQNRQIQNRQHQARWGGNINGHWSAGMRAPGGWQAYRRPVRGYRLPSYWVAPTYYINDFASFGLSQPPYGYNWSRYYDDAVLVNGNGQVWDSVSGVDWDRYDNGYGYDYAYGQDGYNGQDGYVGGSGYAPQQGYYERRDDGVGGAIIGGVVGGVVGNRVAGRGNRTAGTLIGAGVGAAAGYAIDRNEDRGRYAAPPPRYGTGYAQPGYGQSSYNYQSYAAPQVVYDRPREVVQPVYSSDIARDYRANSAYFSGGYAYGPTTTTVTIQSAPVVTTTTTTEYIEEEVATTTSSKPVRKVYRKAAPKRKWHPKPKPVVRQCGCDCGCR